MAFFKKVDYSLHLSQADIELYLCKITQQKNRKPNGQQSALLYKGQVLPKQFTLCINRWHQLIRLNGAITIKNQHSVNLELTGKFVWRNLILNGLIFISSSSVLLLLSLLLLQENTVQGFVSMAVAAVLSYGLFRNLIGRLKADYAKMSSDLIHLLSVSTLMH